MDRWPLRNFGWAFCGLGYALRTQRNIRTLLLIALAALLMGVVLGLTVAEFAILVLVISLLIVAELFNTALESVADLATDGLDPKAKVAKDVAAAAVLVTGLGAIAAGALIFIPHLIPR